MKKEELKSKEVKVNNVLWKKLDNDDCTIASNGEDKIFTGVAACSGKTAVMAFYRLASIVMKSRFNLLQHAIKE